MKKEKKWEENKREEKKINLWDGRKKGKERKRERADHALPDFQCSEGQKSICRELKLVYSTRATSRCQKQKEVGVFSYTGSFSLKGRKWSCDSTPTIGLSFRTLGLFFGQFRTRF